jgi:thioredoxin-like negative regulator of GroEL
MDSIFTKVNRQQFIERIVIDKTDSLVKFGSRWSGSAELLKQLIEDVAVGYQGRLNFFCIDSEIETDLTDIYHIESFPALLFFRKGTLIGKLSGLVQKSVISSKIEQILN